MSEFKNLRIVDADSLAMYMRLYRQAKGLTQKQLASKAAVKQSTVSMFERHPDHVELSTFFRLLKGMKLELTLAEKKTAQDTYEEW